jgi:hypothetical protein
MSAVSEALGAEQDAQFTLLIDSPSTMDNSEIWIWITKSLYTRRGL